MAFSANEKSFFLNDPVVGEPTASHRGSRRGRARSTSKAELGRIGLSLFIDRGFSNVTVEDIAHAAGIGRRTFFRYFASKNDVAWGDFEELLVDFRANLHDVPGRPLVLAVRDAVRKFNEIPDEEHTNHRHRMRIVLETPELVAHSTMRYSAWRAVIADFVGERLGLVSRSPVAQAFSWACLGISLSAYEQWLADDSSDLLELIDESFAALGLLFGAAGTSASAPSDFPTYRESVSGPPSPKGNEW